MAQPNHQQYSPPPRAFSPPQRTDSPHLGPPGPYAPTKRQAVSPNNQQSPFGSPGMTNIQLPNQLYSAPYYGAQPNGHAPYAPYSNGHNYGSAVPTNSNPPRPYAQHSNVAYNPPSQTPNNIYAPTNMNESHTYNTMNSPQAPTPPQSQATGGMGPPARPADNKPTDINELGDVMAGSGIDLREEEAALLQSYSKQRHEAGQGVSSANKFGTPYVPPRDNFYSRNTPGDRNSFYGAGFYNQEPGPAKSAEEIDAEARKKTTRRRAEIHSYHLNNPFLSSGCLHRRLIKEAHGMQVTVPKTGISKSAPGRPPAEIYVEGADKNPVLKVVHGEDLLAPESPLVEMLVLLSLATEERVRGFVEDSATLAKGRRIGSHGVVPADLHDLAAPIAGSEKVAVPKTESSDPETKNPLKRSYSDVNQSSTPTSENSQRPSTVAFSNPVAEALQKLAKDERAHEEARLAKRQRRAAGGAGTSSALGTPGSTGTLGDVAPDADLKKSGKAKEKLDEKARKATEAQQHAATTKTANMALGLSGAMGKKLSWMTPKGGSTGPSNPFLQKPNASAQTAKASTAKIEGAENGLPKARTFGDFREDRETGAGIQLRDIVAVLERDGKEKKAVQRAYGRFGSIKQ